MLEVSQALAFWDQSLPSRSESHEDTWYPRLFPHEMKKEIDRASGGIRRGAGGDGGSDCGERPVDGRHSGDIVSGWRREIPKLKVLKCGELPAGWVGKNYAASVGAAAAVGDWLLFTDADTYHYPDAARRALRMRQSTMRRWFRIRLSRRWRLGGNGH